MEKIKRFLGNPVNEGDKILSEEYKKWVKASDRFYDKIRDYYSNDHDKIFAFLEEEGKEEWDFHKRDVPRQSIIFFLAGKGLQSAIKWLQDNPEPIKYVEPTAEDNEPKQYYGLYSDGGNCYSSRDDGNWYWSRSDADEDRRQFASRCRRQARRQAEQNYREYCPEYIKVKIFESKDAFIKACKKVGFEPRLEDD